MTKYPGVLSGKPLLLGLFATYGTPCIQKYCDAAYYARDWRLGRAVAVSSFLGHHEFVIPETELVPEIRKTGHRLADLAVAFSALFVSLCSLGIALHHGRTMQRLVEANSRPFIQFTTTNGHPAADSPLGQAFSVLVSNPGAGAARVERFSILVDDKPVKDIGEALLRLAGLPADTRDPSAVLGPMTYLAVAPSYIKAGSDQPVLLWPRTASNASVWDMDAEAGLNRVTFEACYCSIFDECWIENSHRFRPTAVASCS